MYMDDIKVFSKKEKELVILLQTIRLYSLNIVMSLSNEKYPVQLMKSGLIKITEGRALPNKERN